MPPVRKKMCVAVAQSSCAMGKSTILREIAKDPSFEVNLEPLSYFEKLVFTDPLQKNTKTINYLKRFYDHFGKKALSEVTSLQLQIVIAAAIIRRERQRLERGSKKKILLLERDISSTQVFINALRKSKHISAESFGALECLSNELAKIFPKPDLVILLSAPARVAERRLKARGRLSEQSVNARYLKSVVLEHNRHFAETPNLLVLDARLPVQHNVTQIKTILKGLSAQNGEHHGSKPYRCLPDRRGD